MVAEQRLVAVPHKLISRQLTEVVILHPRRARDWIVWLGQSGIPFSHRRKGDHDRLVGVWGLNLIISSLDHSDTSKTTLAVTTLHKTLFPPQNGFPNRHLPTPHHRSTFILVVLGRIDGQECSPLYPARQGR